MEETRELYLELMKSSVTNLIYLENEYSPIMPRGSLRQFALKFFRRFGIQLCHARRATLQERLNGTDHTSVAHTMISMARLENVQECIETILRESIPGDFIETGVLRGGCGIFMRGMLKAHGVANRKVWLADSFAGLPAPDPEMYPADAGSIWHEFMGGEVSVEHVQRNFSRYGLLDDQVVFVKGWFRDTLPTVGVEKLSLIRLDGDLYESTMDALVNLYPKLSMGGYVIVDDYFLDCCRDAVHDYRQKHNIHDPLVKIDEKGVYWKRGTLSA